MRAWTALAAGAAIGTAVLAGVRAAEALQDSPAPAPAARPACIALVNVSRAFQSHPRKKKLEETLQADLDAANAAMESKKSEIRKEAQDLEARYSPGTPEYQQGLKRIRAKEWEAEFDGKAAVELLKRKEVTALAEAYREIAAEAERIAKEKGFSAVANFDDEPIQVEDKATGQILRTSDLVLQIRLRTVLWASPEVDLTKEVIAALEKGK